MNSLTSAWVTSHQQTISIIVKDRRPVSNFGKESQIDKKCKHAMRKGFLWHSERVTLNDQANRLHHTSSPTSLVVNLASVIVTVVLPLLILQYYRFLFYCSTTTIQGSPASMYQYQWEGREVFQSACCFIQGVVIGPSQLLVLQQC